MKKDVYGSLVRSGQSVAKEEDLERAIAHCAEFLLSLPSHVLNLVPPHPDPKFSLHQRLSGPVPRLAVHDLQLILAAARRTRKATKAIDERKDGGGPPRKNTVAAALISPAECDAARRAIWIACSDQSHPLQTWRNGACICDACHKKVEALEAHYKASRKSRR